jgi:hypothetical protein
MSLFLATLLTGIGLTVAGVLLLLHHPLVVVMLKALPRSPAATLVFFGGGLLWFLVRVATMGDADRIIGNSNVPWVAGFAVLGVLSVKYVPDFLAVRGLSILTLLAATPLLDAAYMQYDHPQRLFLVSFVFVAVIAALFLAVVPYRLRDFFQWLLAAPARARALGAGLLLYGVGLNVIAFTY